jgi:hypothetical protein
MPLTENDKNNLKNKFKSLFPEIDLSGSVIEDLFIHSGYLVLEILKDSLDKIERVFFLNEPEKIEEDLLDRFASNFGIKRNPGSKATGIVRFYSSSIPSEPKLIPAGTVVSTVPSFGEETLEYLTKASAFFYKNAIWDPYRRKYYIEVPIEAKEIGSKYNKGALTITRMVSELAGLEVLNPTAISGGSDKETNTQLAEKIKKIFRSAGLYTKDGIKQHIFDNFASVKELYIDIKPVKIIKPEFLYSIPLHIYVKGEDLTISEESFIYQEGLNNEYSLLFAPFYSLNFIEVIHQGAIKYLELNKDFTIVFDEELKKSAYENGKIIFNWTEQNKPDPLSIVTVSYIYNKTIYDIQNYLNSDENKIIGTEAIVFESIKKKINIKLEVYVKDLGLRDTTENLIRSTIISKIAEHPMGKDFVPFNIIEWVLQIDNVDTVNFRTFEPREVITLVPNEELRVDNENIFLTIL